MRHVARPQHDVGAGAGVAGHARLTLAQAETAEAAQLHPIVLRQAFGDMVEYQLDGLVHVAWGQVFLLGRDPVDQLAAVDLGGVFSGGHDRVGLRNRRPSGLPVYREVCRRAIC